MFIQYAGDGSRNSVGGETGERAKRESLNRPQLQYMEVLDAMNWTRWRFWPGASFCPTITPTHNVFKHSELDTVASSAKRIFLRKAIVQGWSKTQKQNELLARSPIQPLSTYASAQSSVETVLSISATESMSLASSSEESQSHSQSE